MTQILKMCLTHPMVVVDLEAAISGLNANKGPGNDGVPPSFV
jgi:hypothetical protein